MWLPQSSKKRNRKHSGDDSFDEGSVSESESESESGQAEEEKEEAGWFYFLLLVHSLPVNGRGGEKLVKPMGGWLLGRDLGVGWEFDSFSVLSSKINNKNSPTPTTSCIEETLKEKEKPKEEEKEKPKDTPGLECKPRPLHKTCSLFMRNIAPNISRAEIISVSGENGMGGGGAHTRWGEDNLALLLTFLFL